MKNSQEEKGEGGDPSYPVNCAYTVKDKLQKQQTAARD